MARGKRQASAGTATTTDWPRIIDQVRAALQQVRRDEQAERILGLEALVGRDATSYLDQARSGLWLEPRLGPDGVEIEESDRLAAILTAQEIGRDDLADLMATMLAEWADRRRVELEDENRCSEIMDFRGRRLALERLQQKAEALKDAGTRRDRINEYGNDPSDKKKRAVALDPIILRLLSGGDLAGVRVAVNELFIHEADGAGQQLRLAAFGDAEVERLRRYTEAQQALDRPPTGLAHLLMRLEDRDLARIGSARAVGEQFVLEGADYRRIGLFSPHTGPGSAHDFVPAIRELIEERRFHKPDFDPGPRLGEEIYCPVSSREAFEGVIEENRGHPSFDGVKILACSDHSDRPGTRRLFAAARFVGEVDGEIIAANAVLNLGKDSRMTVARTMITQALEVLEAGRVSPDPNQPHTVALAWRARVNGAYGWHGLSRGELSNETPAAGPLPDGWMPAQTACRHPSAHWKPNQVPGLTFDGQAYSDALHLVCDDCGRSRLACLPLHQIAPHRTTGDPSLKIAHPDAYLQREAAYAALNGRPAAKSIEELRARDGFLPLNPARWLRGEPPVARRSGDPTNRSRVQVDDLGAPRRARPR